MGEHHAAGTPKADYFNQVSNDLDKKRPTSRRIADQWNADKGYMPAYAIEHLEPLDENRAVKSDDLPVTPLVSKDLGGDDDDEDDHEALVYVLNPDRVVSQRISKRLDSKDQSLLDDRMSRSNASMKRNSNLQDVMACYSMVDAGKLLPSYIKSCDCALLGRSGSQEHRAFCQDEVVFACQDDGTVFGVFDGHGPDGHLVAAVCARELVSCLKDDVVYYLNQKDFTSAVREGMACLQRRLEELPPNKADIEISGATATIGYCFKDGTVYIANVGDTRAIGARRDAATNKFSLVQLSDEHILSNPREADRIIQSGGRVEPIIIDGRPIGPPRCWYPMEGSAEPGLMVSRTLGDSNSRRIGVNAECAIYTATNLSFVIVASDGLWEVMTSEEAIGFVATTLVKPIPDVAISEMLCLEAKKRWMQLEMKVADDISVYVIMFAQ